MKVTAESPDTFTETLVVGSDDELNRMMQAATNVGNAQVSRIPNEYAATALAASRIANAYDYSAKSPYARAPRHVPVDLIREVATQDAERALAVGGCVVRLSVHYIPGEGVSTSRFFKELHTLEDQALAE